MSQGGACSDCERYNRLTCSERICEACRPLRIIDGIYQAVVRARLRGDITRDPTKEQLLETVDAFFNGLSIAQRRDLADQLDDDGFAKSSLVESMVSYADRVVRSPRKLMWRRPSPPSSHSATADDTYDIAGRRAERERAIMERRAREGSITEWPGRHPPALRSSSPPTGDPLDCWVPIARGALWEKARHYNSVAYLRDLAQLVDAGSPVVRPSGYWNWIGDTLLELARECIRRGEPILSALCVNPDGTVAVGYLDAIRETGWDELDLDSHAAHERLRCYRHYRAVGIPPEGGSPAYPPDLAVRPPASEQPNGRQMPRAATGRPRTTRFNTWWDRHSFRATPVERRTTCPNCNLIHPGDCF